MVGAVLQAALARHCCYLSQGAGGGGCWGEEGHGKTSQEDRHQILSSFLYTCNKADILKAEEEIPKHAGFSSNRYCEA